MATPYPIVAPYASGQLPVGDGHVLHWEQTGDPNGIPVVVLHGGPGEGSHPESLRFFDPTRYRMITFDQRGSGRSTPRGSVTANTPTHLVADIERLRAALDIERWLVFGGSWGATLAWLYAKAHRSACLGIILRGFAAFDTPDIDWFWNGMSRFNVAAWREMTRLAGRTDTAGLIAAFDQAFSGDDAPSMQRHAQALSAYIEPCATIAQTAWRIDDASKRLTLYRIFLHYCRFQGLATDWFLEGPETVENLPGIVVQGSHDLITPPRNATRLAQRWPGLRLHLVQGGGHSGAEPAMADALVLAAQAMLTAN